MKKRENNSIFFFFSHRTQGKIKLHTQRKKIKNKGFDLWCNELICTCINQAMDIKAAYTT